MMRTIFWALGNLPMLISLVTATISVVEALGAYINEQGDEKKQRAIALLRENLTRYVTLPDFVNTHLDALLGILIDAVVLILNLTRGRDWGARVEDAVADAVHNHATIEQLVTATVPQPNPRAEIDAKLDDLEAKLRRE